MRLEALHQVRPAPFLGARETRLQRRQRRQPQHEQISCEQIDHNPHGRRKCEEEKVVCGHAVCLDARFDGVGHARDALLGGRALWRRAAARPVNTV